MNYRDLLMDPRWQKKRLEILQARGFKCENCFDETTTLHVHHRYYISHRKPWLYPDFCYQVLCTSCHDVIHHDQKCEVVPHFDWEIGLDHFGERVYGMSFDELTEADYRSAHGLPPIKK
jgi:hypothetical protein